MKFILLIFTVLISANEITQISANDLGRVVFGTTMTLAELVKFNYQVVIHVQYNDGKIIICGGSLIAPDVVITAAHCLGSAVDHVNLIMGQTDRGYSEDPGIKVYNDRLVVHEYYTNPEKYGFDKQSYHDIGLILLPTPVTLSSLVNTIPLASVTTFDCENVNATAWVSGPGNPGKTTIALNLSYNEMHQLRYAQVQPFPWDECFEIYTNMSPDRTQLCTRLVSGKTGSGCDGDSGGPYAFDNPNDPSGKRVLCGLVSFGGNCEEYPASVYTRVSYFVDNGWICEHSGGKAGCLTYE